MSNYLVVDVETLPLIASLEAPYPEAERPYPANYKAPEAIAGWREKDKAAWQEGRIKECSLSPRLGRIACLGWKFPKGLPDCWAADQEDEERTILTKFWEMMDTNTTIVTFNGTSFDLRFIAIRSAILGIHPVNGVPVAQWFRRYYTRPHFDVRSVLTGWDDRQSGKLHEWAQAFGIPVTDQTSGADIHRLATEGNWTAIADHCKADVDLTDQLYLRIKDIYS